MSGILERIEAKLDQLLQQSAPVVGVAGQQPVQPQLQPQPQLQAQLQPNMGLGLPGQQQAAQTGYPVVSAEQITALITPHVENPNLKAALQQQMAAMGISALPDAQPHQYGELYHRFTQVIGQFQAAAAAQPTAPASII